MISCVIINYNSKHLLPRCLDSLNALEFSDKEIIFIDNASTDKSAEFVLKNHPDVNVVSNRQNLGYARAANQAMEIARGEFILILNPDIVFEPDYLDVLVKRLLDDGKIGAIIGKLRKYDFTHDKKTNVIDSAGLVMHRNRRCVDRGQGEDDRGQYDVPEEVFGVTGACPLYRKKAMEDIAIESAERSIGEIFDNDFFMYKEDVDVSWRLNLRGWKCFYEPAAVAYHGRGTGAIDRNTAWSAAKNRKSLSRFQKYYSYKNERLMRLKNDLGRDVLRDLLPIIWKEVLMTGWMVLREPFLIKSVWKFLWQMPKILKKRREIMRRRKIDSTKRWFT